MCATSDTYPVAVARDPRCDCAYLVCRQFDNGVTTRRVFKLWGMMAVINFVLEAPGLLTHVYTYYGKQPLNLWGQPLWWGGVNAVTLLIAGALVIGAKRFLGTGWSLAGVVPLIFIAEGASNTGTAWPRYAALNDGTSPTPGPMVRAS
jgi:hypothetical protein